MPASYATRNGVPAACPKRSLEATRGLPPRGPAAYGLSPPLFQPLTAYAARGRIFPTPARGTPYPESCHYRAISRGGQRFVTVTSRHLALRAKLHRSPDRSASQADSASSILVTRSRFVNGVSPARPTIRSSRLPGLATIAPPR